MAKLRNDWSTKLDDALWTYKSTFKTHLGFSPYQLVYTKACCFPVKLEHKAYWALKFQNFDEKLAGRKRLLKLDELEEIQLSAYENALIYKERTKRYHDKKLVRRNFQVGQQVLQFNSRLRLFLGKLKCKWLGPFVITEFVKAVLLKFKILVIWENLKWMDNDLNIIMEGRFQVKKPP